MSGLKKKIDKNSFSSKHLFNSEISVRGSRHVSENVVFSAGNVESFPGGVTKESPD
jgi:hypothetical protein